MLRKYAAMQILESSAGSLSKQAHKHDFKYDVEPGYIYVVSRAISSRCNDNHDHFPAAEIKQSYQSFIGKPVFVNHSNDDHKRARGVIIDAALHEDKNRDGSPDTWVAVNMMIDAKTFPKLAQEILAGNIERTSMGVDVERSVCSACNNVATTPMEYCAHIPRAKGQMLYKHDQRTGAKSAHLIYESCYGLHFFENSLLVEPPADPTAFFLSVDARGVDGKRHEKTASQASPLMQSLAKVSMLPKNLLSKQASLTSLMKEAIKVVRPGPDDDDIPHEQLPDGHPGKDPFYVAHSHSTTGGNPDHGFGKGTYGEEANENHEGARPHHRNIVQSWNESTPDERHRGANWYKNAQFVGESLAKNSPRLKQDHGDEHGNVDNHTARARGAAVLAHHSAGVGWYHNMDNASETFRKGHAEGGKGRGRQITDVMAAKSNAVLDMPKGKNDYAHTFDNAVVSKQVGNARKKAQDEGRPEHEVRAAEEEARSGVKGPNPNGSYKNSPKTRNFAHLMEHGGDEDHDGTPSRRVVVDRHALSVAMGKRMGTQDMASWKSEGHHYDYIGNMYRRASDHISKQEGRHVPPHEVQAVTWLRQKRKNDEEDLQKVQQGSGRNKAQFNNGDNQQKQWHKTVDEHHPDLKGLRYGPGEHETDQHTEPVAKRPWNEGEEK